MLKHILTSIIQAYSCPHCGAKEISENNIEIVGTAGTTLNIDMCCPACQKHFMAKTEVVNMQGAAMTPELMKKIQNSLASIKQQLGGNIDISEEFRKHQWQESQNKKVIRDEDIVSLQKMINTNKLSAKDLFSENP